MSLPVATRHNTQFGYALDDPRYGGAQANGSDDSSAFASVWAHCVSDNVPLVVPAGADWHLNASLDPGANWHHPMIIGAGFESSTIILGMGVTLLSTTQKLFGCHFRDFTTSGGLGVFHSQYTSGQVAQHYVFDNLRLFGYTGCAIANESFDNPFLVVRNCEFTANDYLATIGIAWSGQGDGIFISGNSFNKNRVHVKLSFRPDDASVRGPKNSTISDNGFLRFARGANDPSTHSIWIVPGSASGGSLGGMRVSGNKFGSENLRDATTNGIGGIANADGQPDTHVLFADQDAIGSDNTNRLPVFTASTGVVDGFYLDESNMYNMANTAAAPITDTLVYSTTPYITGCKFGAYCRQGSPLYTLKLAYDPAPVLGGVNLTASPYNQQNIFGPLRGRANGIDSAAMQPSNYPGFGALIDPNNQYAHPRLGEMGGISITGYQELLSTRAGSLTVSASTTKANVTDAAAGSDAIEVTFATNGTLRGTLASCTAGIPIYIDFDLKAGATGTPLTGCEMSVLVVGEASSTFRRTSVLITSAWQQRRFSFVPRDSRVYTFQLRGPAAGTVQIGRINVYHNREPVSHGPYLIRSANGTLHRLTVDNSGALVVA